MRNTLALAGSLLITAALVLGGCPKKEQQKDPTEREKAAIRGRADDAFADLERAERGEPTVPDERTRLDEDEMRPEPKPEPPPEPEVERKPPDAVPVNPARSAPAWVNSQPRMPGYYVGIGVATDHGDEAADWARARNHAYVELASTLKVHINSVITDYFREKNLKLYEGDNITKDASRQDSSYSQDTQFFVQSTLEGVEIHDRWKDQSQTKYWMLVRLSKAEIERRLRERLQKARDKAVDHVEAALRAEQRNDIGGALKGYFKAYLALREYFGGVVEYDIDGDGDDEVLNHAIERAVDRLATGLSWQPSDLERSAVIGQGLSEPLKVVVEFGDQPVRSLPVHFAFQRGEGTVESQVSTGDDGSAQAQVVKVFGDRKAIVAARVDAGALLDRPRETRVVLAKFANALDRASGKFVISLEELSAYVDIGEELFGREVDSGSIAAELKQRLHSELGLVFTRSSRGADLEITGSASVARADCSDFFAQRKCKARIQITVTNRLKGRQLFSKSFTRSGNGPSDREAGRQALRKAGQRVAKKIIEAMK